VGELRDAWEEDAAALIGPARPQAGL